MWDKWQYPVITTICFNDVVKAQCFIVETVYGTETSCNQVVSDFAMCIGSIRPVMMSSLLFLSILTMYSSEPRVSVLEVD